jgi:hypothetical protein
VRCPRPIAVAVKALAFSAPENAASRLTLSALDVSPDNHPSCLRDGEEFPIIGEQCTIGKQLATISARRPSDNDAFFTQLRTLLDLRSHAPQQNRPFFPLIPDWRPWQANPEGIESSPNKLAPNTPILASKIGRGCPRRGNRFGLV